MELLGGKLFVWGSCEVKLVVRQEGDSMVGNIETKARQEAIVEWWIKILNRHVFQELEKDWVFLMSGMDMVRSFSPPPPHRILHTFLAKLIKTLNEPLSSLRMLWAMLDPTNCLMIDVCPSFISFIIWSGPCMDNSLIAHRETVVLHKFQTCFSELNRKY